MPCAQGPWVTHPCREGHAPGAAAQGHLICGKPQCSSKQVTLGQSGQSLRSMAKFLVSKCVCVMNFKKGEQ